MKWSIRSLVLVSLTLFVSTSVRAATSTGPASTKPAATVSADAKPILAATADAYQKLKNLTMTGDITGEFDVDGQQNHEALHFTSAYAAPNQFRHDVTDDALLGSTGTQLYFYAKERNSYLTQNAPKNKVLSSELP